jgi:hypothetical protein
MWFHKRKSGPRTPPSKLPTDPVVVEVHLKTEEAAQRAAKSTAKVNQIFAENGITLNIHVAAGGKHGH